MTRPLSARLAFVALLLLEFAATGCTRSAPNHGGPVSELAPSPATTPASYRATATRGDPSPAAARRVIRTAELWLEADAPDAASAKLASVADARGGFVVSSESSRARDADGTEIVTATVVFRIPSASFDDALVAAKALGTHVSNEKITGQDVTEEYVDLEARITAQRAVEEQYLSVLKQATSIPDILSVEQKLGEVRTEIERAEGRRRFLENQTSLSTVTIHLSRHAQAIETSGPGFGRSVREAGRDAVSVSVAIINGAIRVVGVLLPVGALLVTPGLLLLRAWMHRRRRAVRAVLS